MNRLERLRAAGVSIWLDTLSRELLDTGGLADLISGSAVTGATSNPTIFAYAATAGRDGFVSFECTPDLAHDTAATIGQAVELWDRIACKNAMIKVPATEAGIPAIEDLTARGINVNITLLFSVARYEQVMDAYLAGLERRLSEGSPVDGIASVASFFVSRVDAKVDPQLPPGSELGGRVAIANAQLAYSRYRERFAGQRWQRLREAGAQPQRPLWASTGTRNPSYSDVLYVEDLVAPGVVNTMPEATLQAFADHGDATRAFPPDGRRPEETLRRVHEEGIDLAAVTAQLEDEGVQSFCDSYGDLLACIAAKVDERERRWTSPSSAPAAWRAGLRGG